MKIVLASNFNDYFGLEILRCCTNNEIEVECVVYVGDQVDRKSERIFHERMPNFRGLRITDLDFLKLPVYFVRDLNGSNSLSLFEQLAPDLILQGGGPIYGRDVLQIPKIGVLNSHPGLLPKYRGCCAVEWAIFNDDPVGVTCHFLDEGIDSGPIVHRAELAVSPGDTYEDVRTRAFFLQVETMVRGIEKVCDGVRPHDAEQQPEGIYWKPAGKEVMDAVREKLSNGTYTPGHGRMATLSLAEFPTSRADLPAAPHESTYRKAS